MNTIITIGREVGSGGRVVGEKLAEALGFRYLDREILAEIAQHSSLTEDYVQEVVERRPKPAFTFAGGQMMAFHETYATMPTQAIYQAQRLAVQKLAEHSSCVIIGRCADYILRDMHPIRIFLYADLETRVKRCLERQQGTETLDEKAMRQLVQRLDKERAKYYDFYTGLRWGAKENYDLCLNTAGADLSLMASILADVVKRLRG